VNKVVGCQMVRMAEQAGTGGAGMMRMARVTCQLLGWCGGRVNPWGGRDGGWTWGSGGLAGSFMMSSEPNKGGLPLQAPMANCFPGYHQQVLGMPG
jgi:hypothetical protein